MTAYMYNILILVSFLLLIIAVSSVVLQYRTYDTIKKVALRQASYQEELEGYKNKLFNIRLELLQNDDDEIDLITLSDIRTLLYSFQNKCEGSLSSTDRNHLVHVIRLLNETNAMDRRNNDSNPFKQELCAELDYFIARFDRSNSIFTKSEVETSRVHL